MLLAVIALQFVLILLMVALLLRRQRAATDERLVRLPDAVVAMSTRLQAMDDSTRASVADLQTRTRADEASRQLRQEITAGLSKLENQLTGDVSEIRKEVDDSLKSTQSLLLDFLDKSSKRDTEAGEKLARQLRELLDSNTSNHQSLRESVQGKLSELGQDQRKHHEDLRTAMQGRLDKLNTDNLAKLEEMRLTVDEKLNATLNERLTTSFGQVTTHLGEVQKGLGEMREFATGVSDLKRVFSNVKARGVVGEFQLGMQLEQMFSREQYEKNVEIKPGSGERVEYALKVPQGTGTAFFAIDSKFPREDWERLQDARESGTPDEVKKAGDAFDRAIRTEGKRICEKYIAEPVTLPHAILFLPTEGLYAEVMQRPGLQSDLQHACNVTIAGPSTLMAILTSFRMGFHTIAMERKGREIEQVLGRVKTEFGNFGDLLGKAEKQVGTVQNTLHAIRGKTTTITRSLKSVVELPLEDGSGRLIGFEEIAGVAPLLAAAEEE